MTERATAFAREWISENVHNEPLVDGDGYDHHISELWTEFVVAASRAGIALPEIEASIGDLEDRLKKEFDCIYDPTVGGIKD